MPLTGSGEVVTNPNTSSDGTLVPRQALVLSNGNTLMGWTDEAGSPPKMMLQLFDAAGNPLGAAFTLPADLGNATAFGSAIAGADGSFYVQRVVSGEVIDFLHFDSAGTLLGQSETMSKFSNGFEMTVLPDGGLAVFGVDLFEVPQGDGSSWYVEKPVLRILDAAGNQLSQTIVEGTVQNSGDVPLHADISVLPNGNIVATWVEPLLTNFDLPSLHAQVFSPSGVALAPAQVIDSGSGSFGGFTTNLVTPVVEAFADGSFIMTWNDIHGLTFQVFNADGSAQGPKATLTTDLTGYHPEYAHDMITLPDGTFVVAGFVGSLSSPTGYDIVARQFNRDGTPAGDWVPVNTTTTGDQGQLDLVAMPGGGFTAVWLDRGEAFDPWNGSVDTVLDLWRHRSFNTGQQANRAPMAQNGTGSSDEDNTITGQVAASDPDGDSLTYTLVTGPEHGTIVFNPDGSYVYTPGANYNGTDSFTFRASDGSLTSNVATIALAIAAVNDAPELANPLADSTTAEDAAFNYTLPAGTFSDVDNAVLVFSVSSLPAWLSFDPATRTFSGTPANGDVGSFDVTVTASDGSRSASDTFRITVTNTNDAPTVAIAVPDQAATEGTAFSFTLPSGTFADADVGDSLTIAPGSLPAWLSYDPATGIFSGTPGAGNVGPVDITVTATDRAGATVSDTFRINVAPSGPLPILGTEGRDFLFGTGNDDIINALGGNDVVFGANGNDRIDGGAGDDFLLGGSGLDWLIGGTGNDYLFGGDDADRLQGGAGRDTLSGGDGNDRLEGDAGNDELLGNNGNDILIGGAGVDVLEGGRGADIFQFTALSDSGVGSGNRDRITDFTRGSDKIDLAGLDANSLLDGDQAFTFIGNAGFSRVAGQLRYVGGVISADVDGDGIADFQIQMSGLSGTLGGSDFFL